MERNRGEIKIFTLNLRHVQEVSQIEKDCFSEPWSQDAFKREISNENSYFRVAMVNSKVVGYIGMQCICGEGYITNFAVAPGYRNHGIGTTVLQDSIEYAIKNNFEFVSLEVRVSNAEAISLYSAQGFKHCGLRKNFYKKPVEDACIMTRYILRDEDV